MGFSWRRSASLLILALVTLPLAGCSGGEQRDYAVPDEVCGAGVDPTTLEPLLPPGDTVEDEVEEFGLQNQNCSIKVDSRTAVGMTIYLYPDYSDPMERALTYRGGQDAVPLEIGGDDAALWDGGIISFVRCFEEETEERGAYIGLELFAERETVEDPDERRTRVEDFARSLIAGLKQQHGCEV